MASGLYRIVNTTTGDYYVGSARDLARRRRQHWFDLRKGKHANPHLQRSWNRHGEAPFRWEMLEALPVEELYAAEAALLARHVGKPECYNICATPTAGMAGRRHSAVSIEKMAAAMRGRRHSEETKRRMSKAHKGRPVSAEARLNRSVSLRASFAKNPRPRGRKLSQEWIQKRQESRRRNAEAAGRVY